MFTKTERTPSGREFRLTASAGAAIGTENYQNVYDSAYKALYTSEKNGKSSFTMA